MNGVLPLWKPKGMTSHDCVMRVRKLFNTRKVGHTGTLDPEVEGVLGICIGHATKVVPYLTAMKKTYIVECSLGAATETEDAQGEIVEERLVVQPPTKQDIDDILQLFKGEITQIPPMYSAVRVNGKRLYEYARANQEVERPSRQVHIYEIENLFKGTGNTSKFKMKVVCSAGTYMRTLCVDIGKHLGYPAHMSDLIRTEVGSFTAEETVTFSDIEKAVELNEEDDLLIPIASALSDMDRLYVDEEIKRKVHHGMKLTKPEKGMKTDPFLIICDQQLLAIYQTHPENPEQIKPVRVFNW